MLFLSSNVEQSAKFRLRDISPSRLKERRKCRPRKKSDQDTKSISSPRKNVVSFYFDSFQNLTFAKELRVTLTTFHNHPQGNMKR